MAWGGDMGGLGGPSPGHCGTWQEGSHTDVPVPVLSPAHWPPCHPSHPPPRRRLAFGISLLPSGSRQRAWIRGCPPQSQARAPGSRQVMMATTFGSRRKGPSTGASWLENWLKSGIKMPPRAPRRGGTGCSPLPVLGGSMVGFGDVSALKTQRCPFSLSPAWCFLRPCPWQPHCPWSSRAPVVGMGTGSCHPQP